MPKPLFVFLAILGVCAAALAEDASTDSSAAKVKVGSGKPAEKPAFVPTPAPAATPEPKSPNVLQRIFGSRQGKKALFPATPEPKAGAATPAPAAAKSTPAPAARTNALPKKNDTTAPATTAAETAPAPKKRRSKPKATAPETQPAVASTETPETAKPPVEKPAPSTPAPGKKSRKGKTAPVATATDAAEPPADADPETKEKFRFDQAKAKASEDPEVKELKASADGAATEEEAHTAQRAYNKALFRKMRKIDGTLDERINQMEAAILKRLDAK